MPANTRWSPRLFVPTTLPAALLLTGTPLPWSFARSLPPRLRAASFGPLSVLMGNEICRSIVASESGPAATARPWAGIFRDLHASRCAELCGPCRVTAATRVVPFCSRQRSLRLSPWLGSLFRSKSWASPAGSTISRFSRDTWWGPTTVGPSRGAWRASSSSSSCLLSLSVRLDDPSHE